MNCPKCNKNTEMFSELNGKKEFRTYYCSKCNIPFLGDYEEMEKKNIRQDACIHKWKFDTKLINKYYDTDCVGNKNHREIEVALYSCEICVKIRKIY